MLIRLANLIVVVLFLLSYLAGFSIGSERQDVGIYNDTLSENKGVWRQGLVAIKAMLKKYGYTYRDIWPEEINNGDILGDSFKILLVPGGWAATYNVNIRPPGFKNIRAFVGKGGGVLGICAGAYFACDVITWRPGPHAFEETYDYPLNLFNGTGRGVVPGLKPWTSPTGCGSGIKKGAEMVVIKVDTNLLHVGRNHISMLYYGGPWFTLTPSKKHGKVKTAATYVLPKSKRELPAMIFFPYHKGRVFLSGVHPEVSFSDCQLHPNPEGWEVMNSIISLLLHR